MEAEIVYLGHDNTIDLQLLEDGVAVSLAAVTKITATFGDTLVENAVPAAGSITWSGAGYDTGEIRLNGLGLLALEAGFYDVPIVVYTAVYTNGIVWDIIPIRVKEELEA